MININKESQLSIEIINDPLKILKNLHFGTNLPILDETIPYIIHDLKYFNAKSMLLKTNDTVVGNSILYDDGGDTLFFGFFGVEQDKEGYINYLIEELKRYSKTNGYLFLRGPINIPTIIYGWGFTDAKSKKDLFIGKPTTHPLYLESFLDRKFTLKYEELTHETPMYRLNPYKIKKYDFSDYEVIFPIDYHDLIKNLKESILEINRRNLPPSSQITPNVAGCFDSYADFVIRYGNRYMILLVKYKPEDRIVAVATCLPDIFNQKEKGITFHSWAVDPDFRRKGLAILMSGCITLKLWKKFTIAVGHTGADNTASVSAAKSLSQEITRSHSILEYI